MNKIDFELLDDSSKRNLLSYMYLLRHEFHEVNEFINTLYAYRPFELDVRNATPFQKALDIAVVISYSRNFKRSYGFEYWEEMGAEMIKYFSGEERQIHERVLESRDQEFAHSDALPNDIQIDDDNWYLYSRRVVRQLLEKGQLKVLKEMVNKIRDEIEVQIGLLEESK